MRTRRDAHPGFSLIEMLVAVFTGGITIGIAALLVQEISALTRAANRAAAATAFFQAFEQRVRDDIAQLDPAQFMVIRHANIEFSDGPDTEPNAVSFVVAADQFMFFKAGEIVSERIRPAATAVSWGTDAAGDPVYRPELGFGEETPAVVYSGAGVPIDVPRTAPASRVWYGHLSTPSFREWPGSNMGLTFWPPLSWSVGRHELLLTDSTLEGIKPYAFATARTIVLRPSPERTGTAPGGTQSVNQTVVEPLTESLEELFGTFVDPNPYDVEEAEALFSAEVIDEWLALPATTIADIGTGSIGGAEIDTFFVSEIDGSNAEAFWPNPIEASAPALWDEYAIRGKASFTINERLAIDGAGTFTSDLYDGVSGDSLDVLPLRTPVDVALVTTNEIRSFLSPSLADTSEQARARRSRDAANLMRRACFRVEGIGEFDPFTRVKGGGPTGGFSAGDEMEALRHTMAPYASSMRVDWAGDYLSNDAIAAAVSGGAIPQPWFQPDGQLDRYTPDLVALIEQIDPDLLFSSLDPSTAGATAEDTRFIDTDGDGTPDTPVGGIVWFGLSPWQEREPDEPPLFPAFLDASVFGETEDEEVGPEQYVFVSANGAYLDTSGADPPVLTVQGASPGFAQQGYELMRDLDQADGTGFATAPNARVHASFYDVVFPYDSDQPDMFPWTLRFTMTLRSENGQPLGSSITSQRRLIAETNPSDPNRGIDLEASSFQFTVDLPRRN
ncbi:MAG: prepilin-type N-terminal cleavage/methylation domain-containing protein [Planctomycetota bacterium]